MEELEDNLVGNGELLEVLEEGAMKCQMYWRERVQAG